MSTQVLACRYGFMYVIYSNTDFSYRFMHSNTVAHTAIWFYGSLEMNPYLRATANYP